ncbi:MAG: hypothetical protein IKD69_12885 [Solobacterium sp.]|nr:hypothetical protein [Solobacterium sp.]
MKRRRGVGDYWWVLFIFIFIGLDGLLPLMIILGIVAMITYGAVKSSNKREEERSMNYARSYTRTGDYYRTAGRTRYTPAQMARVNVYLRNWFRTHDSIRLGNSFDLRIRGTRYASLASLDVYRNNSMISSLSDFGRSYPDSYNEILDEMIRIAELNETPQEPVIDVEAREQAPQVHAQPEPEPEPVVEEKKPGSQEFLEQITQLNNNIPDEEISNGLYETAALLKQIQILEEKFPDSRDKLKKLYEYYLPILVRILTQYDNLQAAKTDPNYEATKQRLGRTIVLINDAMKTIISSMTDQDFINLSADISTLEAVLQKDGLTNEGRLGRKLGE